MRGREYHFLEFNCLQVSWLKINPISIDLAFRFLLVVARNKGELLVNLLAVD